VEERIRGRLAIGRAALLCALCIGIAGAAEPNQLTARERAAGWRLLFDGKTTDGWLEITGKPFPAKCWTIENGCLKASPHKEGVQDIRTVATFREFELEFDWMLKADGNSGVKYLVQKVDEWVNQYGRQARARGLEYQLAGDQDPDAASSPSRVAGSLYSVFAPMPKVTPKIGEFNHSRLVVRGGVVEHWLNGTRVVRYEIAAPEVQKHLRELRKDDREILLQGPLSLQNHSSETWFRNIKVRVK
jgi:hypothetical protein